MDKNVKIYEVPGNNFESTNSIQKAINSCIENINRALIENNKIVMTNIVFKGKLIDGVAINRLSYLLNNFQKDIHLIFDHCNIKNMDFTNIDLKNISIEFTDCLIDRISIVKSRFRLLNFVSCNIFELQAFGCNFHTGLNIHSCSIKSTEIKCCDFEFMKIFNSAMYKNEICYNKILEINLSKTIFTDLWTINNAIDWSMPDNSISKCYFANTDNSENPIITIDGVGIGTFYYLPTLDIVKKASSTWAFDEFKSYIGGLDMAYTDGPLEDEKSKLEMKSYKSLIEYITKIKEDYNETKLLRKPVSQCESL